LKAPGVRIIVSMRGGGIKDERIAERGQRSQGRRLKHTDKEQQCKALRRQIPEYRQCRSAATHGEYASQSIEPVGDATCRRPEDQADCSAGGKHQRNRVRQQIAALQQGREIRRLYAKRRIKGGVESEKPEKRSARRLHPIVRAGSFRTLSRACRPAIVCEPSGRYRRPPR
jgi:hypothetical protein